MIDVLPPEANPTQFPLRALFTYVVNHKDTATYPTQLQEVGGLLTRLLTGTPLSVTASTTPAGQSPSEQSREYARLWQLAHTHEAAARQELPTLLEELVQGAVHHTIPEASAVAAALIALLPTGWRQSSVRTLPTAQASATAGAPEDEFDDFDDFDVFLDKDCEVLDEDLSHEEIPLETAALPAPMTTIELQHADVQIQAGGPFPVFSTILSALGHQQFDLVKLLLLAVKAKHYKQAEQYVLLAQVAQLTQDIAPLHMQNCLLEEQRQLLETFVGQDTTKARRPQDYRDLLAALNACTERYTRALLLSLLGELCERQGQFSYQGKHLTASVPQLEELMKRINTLFGTDEACQHSLARAQLDCIEGVECQAFCRGILAQSPQAQRMPTLTPLQSPTDACQLMMTITTLQKSAEQQEIQLMAQKTALGQQFSNLQEEATLLWEQVSAMVESLPRNDANNPLPTWCQQETSVVMARLHQATLDVHQTDALGNTLAHYLLSRDYRNLDLARLIVELGANLDCRNHKGQTPADLLLPRIRHSFLTLVHSPSRPASPYQSSVKKALEDYQQSWRFVHWRSSRLEGQAKEFNALAQALAQTPQDYTDTPLVKAVQDLLNSPRPASHTRLLSNLSAVQQQLQQKRHDPTFAFLPDYNVEQEPVLALVALAQDYTDQLQACKDTYTRQLAAKEQEVESYKGQLRQSQEALVEKSTELSQMTTQVQTLTHTNNAFQQQIDALHAAGDQQQQELRACREESASLRTELKTHKEESTLLRQESAAQKEKLAVQDDRIKTQDQKLVVQDQRLVVQQQESAAQKEKLAVQDQKLVVQERINREQLHEISTLKEAYGLQAEQLKAQETKFQAQDAKLAQMMAMVQQLMAQNTGAASPVGTPTTPTESSLFGQSSTSYPGTFLASTK